MKLKKYKKNFNIIIENIINRYQMGGVLPGDYCIIRKDALNNPEIKNKPKQFIEKLKEYINNGLNLKISAVKTSKPDNQSYLGPTPTEKFYVDIVVEYAPGFWKDAITLPLECIDIITPDENNWSPKIPEQLYRKDTTQIKPKKIDFDNEILNKTTKSNERMLPTKNIKIKSAKINDGRNQAKKPIEYKLKK